MSELDSLVHDGSDRRRIIVKQLPERKSEDGALDGGKGPKRVPGSDRLEAPIEVVAGVEHSTQDLAPEACGPLRRDLAILVLHLAQAAVVGVFGVVARGFRFVEGLDDEAARATQNVVGHAITMPPSTWMHWPVM